MSIRRSVGVTLIELVVFIVLVGVAMAGVFAAFNTITAASADPQVRKQALAIAESLMEEVALMPFTWCDPDDTNAAAATGPGIGGTECNSVSEDTAMGPESSPGLETRDGTTYPFDNVSDYHGFTMTSGIYDISNTLIGGLGAYQLTGITITHVDLGTGDIITAASKNALKISITVTGPGNVSITLEGYRTRYAPNTLP